MHLTLNFNFAAYSQKNDYEVKRWTAKRKVGRINWKSKILEKSFCHWDGFYFESAVRCWSNLLRKYNLLIPSTS